MAGVATGSAASGSADGPICQRGDNVHFYVQGGPRRRLDVHDPPLPMTRAGCPADELLNATSLCEAFAAREQEVGLRATIFDAVGGFFDAVNSEPGAHHVIGAWLSEKMRHKGAHTRLSDGVRAVGHAEREAPARRIADPLDAMVSRWLSV